MRDVQNLFERLRREIGSESLEGLGRLLATIDATPGMHPAIRSGILQLASERLSKLAREANDEHERTSKKRAISGNPMCVLCLGAGLVGDPYIGQGPCPRCSR